MGRVSITSGKVARQGRLLVCALSGETNSCLKIWGDASGTAGGAGVKALRPDEAQLIHKMLQGLCDWKGVTKRAMEGMVTGVEQVAGSFKAV